MRILLKVNLPLDVLRPKVTEMFTCLSGTSLSCELYLPCSSIHHNSLWGCSLGCSVNVTDLSIHFHLSQSINPGDVEAVSEPLIPRIISLVYPHTQYLCVVPIAMPTDAVKLFMQLAGRIMTAPGLRCWNAKYLIIWIICKIRDLIIRIICEKRDFIIWIICKIIKY